MRDWTCNVTIWPDGTVWYINRGGSLPLTTRKMDNPPKKPVHNIRQNPASSSEQRVGGTLHYLKTFPEETAGAQKPGGLPQNLVDKIVSYIFDTSTLRSCNWACRSLYIATRPYLHHSLTVQSGMGCEHKEWPKPLEELSQLKLLFFIKRLNIKTKFVQSANFSLSKCASSLHLFDELRNLRELSIDSLDVSSFMSNRESHFGHFESTLQSLTLFNPKAFCWQVLYFVGFFKNLQDLKLCYFRSYPEETAASPKLNPPHKPPLGGTLTLEYCKVEKFVDEMINLHGGFRFRYMELIRTQGMQQIVNACEKSLETLYLNSTSENFFG